eukprot:TRINITY_DN1092_c0_g2_i1.p1 TRINITY_DN1092_c0_g2~~TRINITY_DN1092_c0_g2_i1.p1  ORF type:complete len:378 (+),score=99.80 TRINITY_DN1092_c0_g2_i1:1715-2848(+)
MGDDNTIQNQMRSKNLNVETIPMEDGTEHKTRIDDKSDKKDRVDDGRIEEQEQGTPPARKKGFINDPSEEIEKLPTGKIAEFEATAWVRAILVFFAFRTPNVRYGKYWVYLIRTIILMYVCVGSWVNNEMGQITSLYPRPDQTTYVIYYIIFPALGFTAALFQHVALSAFFDKKISQKLDSLVPSTLSYDATVQKQVKVFKTLMICYVIGFALQFFATIEPTVKVFNQYPEGTYEHDLAGFHVFIELCFIFWPINLVGTIFFFVTSCMQFDDGLETLIDRMTEGGITSTTQLHDEVADVVRAVRLHTEFWQSPWFITQLQLSGTLLFGMLIIPTFEATNAPVAIAFLLILVVPVIALLLVYPAKINKRLKRLQSHSC